jgi:hypothetical protein
VLLSLTSPHLPTPLSLSLSLFLLHSLVHLFHSCFTSFLFVHLLLYLHFLVYLLLYLHFLVIYCFIYISLSFIAFFTFLVIYRFLYISSHLSLYLHFIRTCEYML